MSDFFALLSSLTGGSASFLGGSLTRRVSVYAVTGFGAGIAGIIYALLVTGQRSWDLTVDELGWGAASGAFTLVGNVAFYTALSKGRMGVVSGITSLSVLVPLAYDAVLGTYPTPWQFVGVVACIGGVALVSAPELRGGENAVLPIALAVLATVAYGLIFVTLDLGSADGPLETSVIMEFTVALPLVILAVVARSLGGVQKKDAPTLGAIGMLDAASTLSFAFSTTIGIVALDAVLGSLAPVVTTVLAAVILKQILKPVQYAAIAVILGGVTLVTLG